LLKYLKIAKYRSENNFVELSNNLGRSSNTVKNFDILATSLSVLRDYFDDATQLFSDLFKFLEIIFQQNHSFRVYVTWKNLKFYWIQIENNFVESSK